MSEQPTQNNQESASTGQDSFRFRPENYSQVSSNSTSIGKSSRRDVPAVMKQDKKPEVEKEFSELGREEIAQELGISYKEAVKMSNFELKHALEGKKQPQTPGIVPTDTGLQYDVQTKEQAIAEGTYVENMGPITKEQAIADGSYKEKFNLYYKAGAFVQTIISKLHEKWSSQPKETRTAIAVSALAGYVAFRITGLTHTPNAHAAEVHGSLIPTELTGSTGQTGATGASGATEAISNGTGGAKFEDHTAHVPVFGDIDTSKPSSPVHKDTLENINNFEKHLHAGDTRGGQWVTGGLDENYRHMSPEELQKEVTAKFINRPDVAAKMLWVQEHGFNGSEMKAADPSLVSEADKMVTHGHANDFGVDKLAELKSKMSHHTFSIESSSKYQYLHNTGINKHGELTINPASGFNSDGVIVERDKSGNTIAVFKIDKNEEGKDCLNLLVKFEGKPTSPTGGFITPETPQHHTPDQPHNPDKPEKPEEPGGNTPKGPTFGAEDNTHQYGNNGKIHEIDAPETHQESGAGNPTNPTPEPTPRPDPAPPAESPAPTPSTPATTPAKPSH